MEDSAFGCPIFYFNIIIVWLGFFITLYFKGRYVQFFWMKDIFELASSRFVFVAGMSSTLLTLLLVIVVWSIRNKFSKLTF